MASIKRELMTVEYEDDEPLEELPSIPNLKTEFISDNYIEPDEDELTYEETKPFHLIKKEIIRGNTGENQMYFSNEHLEELDKESPFHPTNTITSTNENQIYFVENDLEESEEEIGCADPELMPSKTRHTRSRPINRQTLYPENPSSSRLCNSKLHLTDEDDPEPFNCFKCGAEFKTQNRLDRHLVKHFPQRYSCTHCPQKFKTMELMKSHIMLHASNKPFKCYKCAKYFKTKGERNLHNMFHAKHFKKFKCTMCRNQYKLHSNYIHHMQIAHATRSSKLYTNKKSP